MADYTIISDVSAYIVRTLRQKMCPEPVPSPNNIEISSPTSQDVDYIVGLYLYDIKEDTQLAQPPMVERGKVQLMKPPTSKLNGRKVPSKAPIKLPKIQ